MTHYPRTATTSPEAIEVHRQLLKKVLGRLVVGTQGFSLFDRFYRFLYRWSLRQAIRALNRHPGVQHVYLRGSLTGSDWIPGLSDVDLIVVVDRMTAKSVDSLSQLHRAASLPFRRFYLEADLFFWSTETFGNYVAYYDRRVRKSEILDVNTGEFLKDLGQIEEREHRLLLYRRICKVYCRLSVILEKAKRSSALWLQDRLRFERWLHATNQLLQSISEPSDVSGEPSHTTASNAEWITLQHGRLKTFAENLRFAAHRDLGEMQTPFVDKGLYGMTENVTYRIQTENSEAFGPDSDMPIVYLPKAVLPIWTLTFPRNLSSAHWDSPWARYFLCRELLRYLRKWRCWVVQSNRYSREESFGCFLERWNDVLEIFQNPSDARRTWISTLSSRQHVKAAEMQWITQHFELPSAIVLQNRSGQWE